MGFEIKEEAISFIKSKGYEEVTITATNVKGGCVGSFKEIEVRLGKPKDPASFGSTQISGITIYYPDSKFMKEGNFVLKLEKVLFLKKLALKKVE